MSELNVLHTEDVAVQALLARIAEEATGAATDAASVAEDERAQFLRELDAQIDAEIRPELEAASFRIGEQPSLVAWLTEEEVDAHGTAATVAISLHVGRRQVDEGDERSEAAATLRFDGLPAVRYVRVSVEHGGEQRAVGAFTVSHLDQAYVEDLVQGMLADLAGG